MIKKKTRKRLKKDREVLDEYIQGRKPVELIDEGVSKNKAYKIYQRYKVFKSMLESYEMVKDLIVSVSNKHFTRLKVKYRLGKED